MLPQTEAILVPPKKNALGQLFQSAFTMPELLKGGKIPSIDGLRAIAILWVIGGHIKHSLNNSSATFNALDIVFGVGQLGVKFFFVISGFLITTLLIKEKLRTSTIDLKKFYIRRFLRIFPVYYLYLAVILVLNFSCGMGISGTTFILAVLYLTNFNMSSYNWSLMHSWSLSVEEQYYLLWPTIFKLNATLATRLAI
ncbi:MAG TPA: acyltransferase, partial [Chitinophagaceae bacterium]|nr:acyltransferase [Chitinophagaceae bacterium]